jgi:hypothetical protein
MSELAIKALGEESAMLASAAGRGHGLTGLMHSMSPDIHGGAPFHYSLRLPPSAGTVQKVMHYGVQPALLGKAVVDTKENIGDLQTIAPEKLVSSGFTPTEAAAIYRQAKGRVLGRAAGDAASWALYPLSVANPALHFPLVLGGSVAAPHLGETIGRKLST